MKFKQILEDYEEQLAQLRQQFDLKVAARVQEICEAIRPEIHISKITCGMGSFVLSGNDFVVLDGEETISYEIDDLFNCIDDLLISDVKYKLIEELHWMLAWWVDTTGGHDVEIN